MSIIYLKIAFGYSELQNPRYLVKYILPMYMRLCLDHLTAFGSEYAIIWSRVVCEQQLDSNYQWPKVLEPFSYPPSSPRRRSLCFHNVFHRHPSQGHHQMELLWSFWNIVVGEYAYKGNCGSSFHLGLHPTCLPKEGESWGLRHGPLLKAVVVQTQAHVGRVLQFAVAQVNTFSCNFRSSLDQRKPKLPMLWNIMRCGPFFWTNIHENCLGIS